MDENKILLPRFSGALVPDRNQDLSIRMEQNSSSLNDAELFKTINQSVIYDEERNLSQEYRFYGKIDLLTPSSSDGKLIFNYREEDEDVVPCVALYDTLTKNDMDMQLKFFNGFNNGNWVIVLAYPYSATTKNVNGQLHYIRHYKTLSKRGDFKVVESKIASNIYGDKNYTFQNDKINFENLKDYLGRPINEVSLLTFYIRENTVHYLSLDFNNNIFLENINDVTIFDEVGVIIPDVDVVRFNDDITTEKIMTATATTLVDLINLSGCEDNPNIYNLAEVPFGKLVTYDFKHDFTLRLFSSTYKEGNVNTESGIPDYATKLDNNGNVRWRDILDIGFFEPDGNGIDYPFMNNTHYFFSNIIISFNYLLGVGVEYFFDVRPFVADTFRRVDDDFAIC